MIYRGLTPQDYHTWRDIRLEALSHHPESYLTSHEEELARPRSATIKRLESGTVLGAFKGRDLCAVLTIDPEAHPAQAHRAWLNAVYVRPDWRGGPVAQGLLEHAVTKATADGLLQLELYVEENNTRAIRFYEKAGFELCGRIPRAVRFSDAFQDDLHYWLRLDPTG